MPCLGCSLLGDAFSHQPRAKAHRLHVGQAYRASPSRTPVVPATLSSAPRTADWLPRMHGIAPHQCGSELYNWRRVACLPIDHGLPEPRGTTPAVYIAIMHMRGLRGAGSTLKATDPWVYLTPRCRGRQARWRLTQFAAGHAETVCEADGAHALLTHGVQGQACHSLPATVCLSQLTCSSLAVRTVWTCEEAIVRIVCLADIISGCVHAMHRCYT